MAAASWNLLMVFVAASIVIEADDSGELADGRVCGVDASCVANNGLNDLFETLGQEGRFDEFNPREPFATDRCSFVNPTLCRLVSALTALGGQGSRSLRAAGNRRFGRLDFLWHGGAEVALDYRRRHVMGLSSDFAHDASQSNWNVEFTWFHEQRFTDNASFSTTSDSDVLNLTLSVDRPTFVRFLNKNRTFFVNGQLFLRYITDWRKNYVENGPLNALFTIGVFTGYHQDRLVPGIQFVYDVGAESGAVLWSVAYRATQNFTIQLGLNTFFGTVQSLDAALVGLGTAGSGGRGEGQQHAYAENGLSTVRDRDEIFIRLRYSF